jgi:hypothetical protein
MRNSIVILAVAATLLVGGGGIYFATYNPTTTEKTTITTVTRTTLGFGGSTYATTTGEYSGCIPPVQCYPTTITTSHQVERTDSLPIALAVVAAGVIVALGVVFASRGKK